MGLVLEGRGAQKDENNQKIRVELEPKSPKITAKISKHH